MRSTYEQVRARFDGRTSSPRWTRRQSTIALTAFVNGYSHWRRRGRPADVLRYIGLVLDEQRDGPSSPST